MLDTKSDTKTLIFSIFNFLFVSNLKVTLPNRPNRSAQILSNGATEIATSGIHFNPETFSNDKISLSPRKKHDGKIIPCLIISLGAEDAVQLTNRKNGANF